MMEMSVSRVLGFSRPGGFEEAFGRLRDSHADKEDGIIPRVIVEENLDPKYKTENTGSHRACLR